MKYVLWIARQNRILSCQQDNPVLRPPLRMNEMRINCVRSMKSLHLPIDKRRMALGQTENRWKGALVMSALKNTMQGILETMNGAEWTAQEIDEMLTSEGITLWHEPHGWMSYDNNIDKFTQTLELVAAGFGYEVSAVYDGTSWFDIAVAVYEVEQ